MADVRAYEQWRSQRDVAQNRTIAEHEAILRSVAASLNGSGAREAYMKEHRLRYEAGGILVQDPERMTATNDAAAQYQQAQYERIGMGAMLGSLVGSGVSVRTFTRAEVLTSLKAIAASKGGITEAITAFENLE